MIAHIKTKEELDLKLEEAGDKLVVLDFFAVWCGPCKTIAPKLEELAKELTDVLFYKIDVEESVELASFYEIDSMPTFVFIKNKKEEQRCVGSNFEKVKNAIAAINLKQD